MSREPDIRDELMKLGQSQHGDVGFTFLGYSVEEKSVKIGCKRKKKPKEISISFMLFFKYKIE